MKAKILIIRMSSLGDIFQCLAAADALKEKLQGEVHWLVREDFADVLKAAKAIDQVWVVHRSEGLSGLWRLAKMLAEVKFTHIYDAHNNLRSHLLLMFFRWRQTFKAMFLRRSKNRWKRFLLLTFKINRFDWPYRGAQSFLKPLEAWGIHEKLVPPQGLKPSDGAKDSRLPDVILAPSAAWELKRWPLDHWHRLIDLLPEFNFSVLGGPKDGMGAELAKTKGERVQDLAGRLTWTETAHVINSARLVISGDTGALHIADYLGTPAIAIIGPTAFGYPSRASSQILEVELPCKPCSKDGRGRCRNRIYQKCLVDVTPERVAHFARRGL